MFGGCRECPITPETEIEWDPLKIRFGVWGMQRSWSQWDPLKMGFGVWRK